MGRDLPSARGRATDTDDGTQDANPGVLLTAPSGVMDLATEVVVRKANAQGCPNTGAGPFGQAGLFASWFNLGQGTPGDDVFAHLFLETSSDPGVLAVVGHMGIAFGGGSSGDFHVGEVRVLPARWCGRLDLILQDPIGHGSRNTGQSVGCALVSAQT